MTSYKNLLHKMEKQEFDYDFLRIAVDNNKTESNDILINSKEEYSNLLQIKDKKIQELSKELDEKNKSIQELMINYNKLLEENNEKTKQIENLIKESREYISNNNATINDLKFDYYRLLTIKENYASMIKKQILEKKNCDRYNIIEN